MATKTPAKGKKPAAKDGAKKARAKAAKPAPVEPEVDQAEDGDEDEDDDEVAAAPAAKPAPAKKPAARGQETVEAPPVVPARRLTPEAKAKVNEMVAKGMPLGDALKAAAAWETFVAPVKEEPAKLVQGKSFDSGPRPPRPRKEKEEDDEPPGFDDEEPAAEAEE